MAEKSPVGPIEEYEKGHSSMVENPKRGSYSDEDFHEVVPGEIENLAQTELDLIELSKEEKRKVMRRLDWILIPQLTILYLTCIP